MSRNSQLSERKNYHLEKPDTNNSSNPLLHIFTSNTNSPLFLALQQELKNTSYKYELHLELETLTPLLLESSRKMFVIVCMEEGTTPVTAFLPHGFTPNSNSEVIRVCTLGGKGEVSAGIPNFQKAKEVVAALNAFAGPIPGKIKLASVHSIKVSKDKKIDTSRSIKKVSTDATYQKVFYLKNFNNEYGTQEENAFEYLVEALEGQANFQPFRSSRELQKKEAPKGKRKYLVLISTNDASIRVMKELGKTKIRYLDYLLLGRLDPRTQFLDDSVLLVSSDPQAHLTFLIENGFSSLNLKNIADRFARQQLQQQPPEKPASSRIIPQAFQAASSKLVSVESPKQEDEHGEKKKIRKIKSPGKARVSQVEPDHEQDASSANINVVISKHTEEPIVENQDYRVNKQGEKIYKKESLKESNKEVPLPTFPNSTNYFDARAENMMAPSKFDSIAPNIDTQFAVKKASNIEAKYRNPSVIIQQMSDEYRGSNKESIMNLEPQKPKNEQSQAINEPIQENTGKKIVNKGISYANEPDTHYINTTRSIEYVKTIPTIPDPLPPTNNNPIEPANNASQYISTTNPRVIAATPMTITSVSNSINANNIQSNAARIYGRSADSSSYQSPPRVIRKEVTVPQVIEAEKPKEDNRITFGSNSQNRITFGSNTSMANNTLNYSNSNASLSSNYRNQLPTNTTTASNNYQLPSSNSYQIPSTSNNITNYNNSYQVPSSNGYYNVQTTNYHTLNNEPYSSKIQVTTGKVQQMVSPSASAQKSGEEVRTYTPYLSSPKVEEKGTKQFITSTLFNSDDYEQIQRDGIIVYRKKVSADTKYTPINHISAKVDKEDDGSPTVRRYETSPLRREPNTYQNYQNVYERKELSSPYTTYDYGRAATTSTSPRNYEVITVPYKAEEHLGEMIESSHKKKTTENTQNNNKTDTKPFVSVSYRTDDRSGISNYRDGGVRVYGVSHPRVEVERVERIEPKVQASPKQLPKLNPKPQPAKHKVEAGKQKIEMNPKAELSPILKNTLNQSNWFSRMSELHSDGSILRRNNIRFGVKLRREEKQEGNSVVENKLVSGIYKVNDLNKKMALNRIIQGEEYIEEEREKYSHINPSLNRFHLLLQEDMDYLHPTLAQYISHPHDRIDAFAGVNSLYADINTHADNFDLGFIFARQDEMAHVNPSLLPQHYFLVSIQGEQGLLEISEAQRRVRIDQLRHFPLVQRIILDSQLYQYVAYRNSKTEVELLADKFVNSEFILQKIETEFTTEILDCYYYELPRLTRLYVLCDQAQLPGLLAVVQAYSQVNPAFKPETCKLVCVLSNILGNDELIMAHPGVTFISNPQQVTHFRHILRYAHHYDAPDPTFLPIDHLFYHNKHAGLEQQLAAHYPGRFAACSFGKVSQVYPKVEKINKVAAKHGSHPKVYLVLHENVNAEKVRVEFFSKIFMLGKAKVVQNKVVRVMNAEELLELLKK